MAIASPLGCIHHGSDQVFGSSPQSSDATMEGPSPNLAASQMSADISWDPSNFSPDGNTQPMHANQGRKQTALCRAERFSTEKWAPCASLRNRCMAFTIHRTGSGQTIDRIPFIEHRDDNSSHRHPFICQCTARNMFVFENINL
ncbi:unnamed protein product, partial [Mesorhabditis belari]|uniref:Uncharacterized protein n=1 Tax=Mesorhabditis belari TaxID=2138241 RepID=A0AAF3F8E2_9BILA